MSPEQTVEHRFVPIGEIRTRRTQRAQTPVQTMLNPDDEGRVVLAAEYVDGLAELDGFDFVWLLTWLESEPEDASPVQMRQVPFLLGSTPRPIGLFAMRGPRRPNPIGLHLVRVTGVGDDGFSFAGVDMLDRTPLLDIKPWVAPLDLPTGHPRWPGVRNGWFDTVELGRAPTPASLAADAAGTGDEDPRTPPPSR